jgi:hypothetical protein
MDDRSGEAPKHGERRVNRTCSAMKAAFLMACLLLTGCERSDCIEAISVETVRAGNRLEIPKDLQRGRASLAQVLRWTASVRQGEDIVRVDLNGDKRDDLLAEDVGVRGVTGNKTHYVFVATERGFRFCGEIGNFARSLTFPSQKSYLITYAYCGPELHVGADELGADRLRPLGGIVLDAATEGGRPDDIELRDRLFKGDWEEAALLRVFSDNAHRQRGKDRYRGSGLQRSAHPPHTCLTWALYLATCAHHTCNCGVLCLP